MQILESPLMKMIYRKFPKTASLPVTCHTLLTGSLLSEWDGEEDTLRPNCAARFLVDYWFSWHCNLTSCSSRIIPRRSEAGGLA